MYRDDWYFYILKPTKIGNKCLTGRYSNPINLLQFQNILIKLLMLQLNLNTSSYNVPKVKQLLTKLKIKIQSNVFFVGIIPTLRIAYIRSL